MAGAGALVLAGALPDGAVIAGWVAGALVSSVVGLVLLRVRLRRIGLRGHLRAIWPVAGPLVGDFGLTSAAAQLLVFLLPLVAGTALLGTLKAAQVANGPLNVATAAASVVCLPLVAAAADSGAGRGAVLRIGRLAAVGLGSVALGYGTLLLLMPENVGHALFGPSWGSALLVAAVSGQQVAIGVMVGALLVLRGSRRTRTILLVRCVLTPVNVLLPLWLAAVWGAPGLSAGLFGSTAATALVWWLVLARLPLDGGPSVVTDRSPVGVPSPRGPLAASGTAARRARAAVSRPR